MSSPEIVLTLEPVAAALSQLNVPFYICGSVASSIQGEPRSTLDIDLVADLQESDVDGLVAFLGDAFYADAEAMREAIRHRSCFNLIHQATFLKVDVFVPQNRDFDREQMQRREFHPLQEGENTSKFPVATAENILLSKLEWYRLGHEISERQWRDVLGVLKINCFDIDIEYLEKWAREIGVADLLERALDEAGWKDKETDEHSD